MSPTSEDGGEPYLVMELVPGRPLSQIVTPPTSTKNSATPRTSPTAVIAPPAVTSLTPGQLDGARGRGRGHDNTKDGT